MRWHCNTVHYATPAALVSRPFSSPAGAQVVTENFDPRPRPAAHQPHFIHFGQHFASVSTPQHNIIAITPWSYTAIACLREDPVINGSSMKVPDESIQGGPGIRIANNATATSSDADTDFETDTTCFSSGCCSRFAALTGLDIHAIQSELQAERSAPRVPASKSDPTNDDDNNPSRTQAQSSNCHRRSVFEGGPDHSQLHILEQKAMALNRVDGPDELYVGGIFALRRPGAMEAKGVTHILSMIKYSFVDWQGFEDHYVHLSVDIDDVDDEDIIVHLPRAVQFVERGLRGGTGSYPGGTTLPGSRLKAKTPADGKSPESARNGSVPEASMREMTLQDESKTDPTKPGAVFVHCAMGKSRSVTAVVAYLLWKYPHRYGLTPSNMIRPDEETAEKAVQAALDWVRKTREIAEPNPGFMKQLEMWVRMGRPAESDDAVERHGTYQRWVWDREVEESAKIGKKPDWIRFEDETEDQELETAQDQNQPRKELRCKKCRRVLVTQQFIIPHQKQGTKGKQSCPHHFVEPLSWMRSTLEEGELDGRLTCPNAKCGSNIGRYAWQGFKCSCGEWVCPAISLSASRVDEVVARQPIAGARPGAAGGGTDPRVAHGIRMPPGRQNL